MRLEEIVQPLVAQALDVVPREGRPGEDFGEQVERGREPLGRHVEGDGERVPACFGVERGTEALRRLDKGDRVVEFGPLGKGPRHEDRRAGFVRRVVARSAKRHQDAREERPIGQVNGDDREAIGEAISREGRERVWTRLSGRGTLGPVGRRRLTHAEPPAGSDASATGR